MNLSQLLARQDLVSGVQVPHLEKLRAAHAPDVWANARIERLPGGYLRLVPRDPTRRF